MVSFFQTRNAGRKIVASKITECVGPPCSSAGSRRRSTSGRIDAVKIRGMLSLALRSLEDALPAK